MSRKYFGTDGVRGRFGEGAITPEFVLKLGWAAGRVLGTETKSRVLIGKDTRISGYLLESALEAGLTAAGVNITLLGPMPTPSVAYLTRTLHAQAGIVISASHNPYQDNGIKFFSAEGQKLPDQVENAIEAEMEKPLVTVDSAHLGRAEKMAAEGRYIEFCKSTVSLKTRFHGMKIVVDCANGAAYKVAPAVLRELGAKVEVIGNKPDGMNINAECGAVHPELLQQAVKEHGAQLGIALDGDADRAIFVCEKGTIVDGDHIMAALGLDLHRRGLLVKSTVVGTVMSNFGLEVALNHAGIQLVRTAVGDRYLLERMLADGYNFGGEQSGHFIFLDHNTTGDGLISALQILSLMKRSEKSLSELAKAMTAVPQVLLNVKVVRKPALETMPELQQAIADSERRLNGSGRVLVRYSGTEPLLRIMVEGERDRMIREEAERLAEIVKLHLG